MAASLPTHIATPSGHGVVDDEEEEDKLDCNGATRGGAKHPQLTPEEVRAKIHAVDAAARARERLVPSADVVGGGVGGGGSPSSSGGSGAALADRSSVQLVYEAQHCLCLLFFAVAKDAVSGAMDMAEVPRRLAALSPSDWNVCAHLMPVASVM